MLSNLELLKTLDLEGALAQAAARNDLLPPREDDKVSGELGKRFLTYLHERLSSGRYDPQPAQFVRVPKAGFTSRPAALLSLADRVLYEALVGSLRPALAKYLVTSEVAMWPRESPT